MKTGSFQDQRPWFTVAITGHREAAPDGPWTWSPISRASFSHSVAAEIRSYLDAVLYRRRESHRLLVYFRDGPAGIDHLIRAYCELREISCLPAVMQRDIWADEASYRRDLEMIGRCHALVWFGPREGPDRHGPDLVTLAAALGIPYRVVPIGNAVTAVEEEQHATTC